MSYILHVMNTGKCMIYLPDNHIHRRVQSRGSGGPDPPPFPGPPPPFSSVTHPTRSHRQMQCKLFLICLICSLGQHFTDINGSKYMLVHYLASKYARFVVLVRLMYWTPPPPHQTIGPPFYWTPFQKSWTRP